MLELFEYIVPKLKENGVRFVSEPVEFRANVWICYFYEPDGEVCEIRES